jgi:hypothetical protein
MVVPHELYRDLSAASEVGEGSRSRAVIDVAVVDEQMASAECALDQKRCVETRVGLLGKRRLGLGPAQRMPSAVELPRVVADDDV